MSYLILNSFSLVTGSLKGCMFGVKDAAMVGIYNTLKSGCKSVLGVLQDVVTCVNILNEKSDQ